MKHVVLVLIALFVVGCPRQRPGETPPATRKELDTDIRLRIELAEPHADHEGHPLIRITVRSRAEKPLTVDPGQFQVWFTGPVEEDATPAYRRPGSETSGPDFWYVYPVITHPVLRLEPGEEASVVLDHVRMMDNQMDYETKPWSTHLPGRYTLAMYAPSRIRKATGAWSEPTFLLYAYADAELE